MTPPNERRAVVVVDTMALSALLDTRKAGRGDAYRRALRNNSVVASFVSVAEILYGVDKAGWGEVRRRAVERDLARISIERPDREAITICAALRAESERRGHALGQKIHEADRWVATAAAMRLQVPLLSNDGVFVGVPGLHLLTTDSET